MLVIGAGAAGIRAALAAAEENAEVLVVTKEPVTQSGSSFSSLSGGWGIQALMGDERTEKNLESFYSDIIRAGLGVPDTKLAGILVEESGIRLEDLLQHGIRLRKNEGAEYLRAKGCFSEHERAFLTEDIGNIRGTFLRMLRASGAKTLLGSVAELIVSDGSCVGAWAVSRDERIMRVMAKATILATGGGAGLFCDHMVSDLDTGGGYALAHHAGAELKNLEFIQFMLGMKRDGTAGFLPLTELKKPGRLLDSNQEDLLLKNLPDENIRTRAIEERTEHHPFSTRDCSRLIDIALARERRAGKTIFWNSENSDSRPFEVMHLAQAFNGGAMITENSETSVPGLFAAGEVAAGPHGADRIGGCMMTATQVFGARAGRFAALRALSTKTMPVVKSQCSLLTKYGKQQLEKNSLPAIASARETFSREVMVLRSGKGLQECLRRIEEARMDFTSEAGGTMFSSFTTQHALTVMELIIKATLKRIETLGPHYRTDTPYHEDSIFETTLTC